MQGVGCEETGQDLAPESSELIDKQTQHGWLSSQRLGPYNVHQRCYSFARQRLWQRDRPPGRKASGLQLRARLLISLDALQGYHYLMPLAHRGNALALATKRVAQPVRAQGVQAFFRFVRLSLRSSLAAA